MGVVQYKSIFRADFVLVKSWIGLSLLNFSVNLMIFRKQNLFGGVIGGQQTEIIEMLC